VTKASPAVYLERTKWFFRPIILLATAYLIISIIHESAHALTAYFLGVPFTMFPYAVSLARDGGTVNDRAIIAVAGPLCALLIGLICSVFYPRARGSRSELILLYFALIGVGTFCGNLMSAAFAGDFSRVALTLHMPMPARYVVSLAGLLLTGMVHFMAGWELRRLSAAGAKKLPAMIVMIVLPAILGTAIETLASLPMPPALLFGRLAEASFWLFGAAGFLASRVTPAGSERTLHLSWADAAGLALAMIALRVMATVAYQP
jgi:hypothetical protein